MAHMPATPSKRVFTRRTESQLMPGEAEEIARSIWAGRSPYQAAQAHNCTEALVIFLWTRYELRQLRRAA